MKKYLRGLIYLAIVFIAGCQSNEITQETKPLAITEMTEVDLISSPNRVDGKIKLYAMNHYETPYLDFNQFLSNFSKMWGDYVKVDRDDTNISITYKYHAEQEIYENKISVDFENSMLYMTNLSSVYAKQIEKPTPVEIDLKEYSLELYVDEQQKLMPLSLCNFFLSQATHMGFLLATDQTLYNVSLYNPVGYEVYTQYEENHFAANEQLQQESVNYLAFLMDNVYGLKEYKEVESYQEILNQQFSAGNYNQNLSDFIVGLDDAHTRIQLSSEELQKLNRQALSQSEYEQNFTKTYERNLCYESNESIVEYRDDVIYMDYRSFTTRDEIKYKNILDESVGKTIIFDIRCNGGGLMNSMEDLLDYLSNEPLTYYFMDIQGGRYAITVNARETMNDYILLTSSYSVSAANLFASYFKELSLGTIIGEKTGGAAASVRYFALPDGTVISLSIDILMTNSKGEIIEDGIEPDIPIQFTKELNLKDTLLKIIDEQ